MTYLPPEILAQVLEYFSPSSTKSWRRPKLAPLATLNRSWQNAVEAILWAKTEIDISELTEFQSRITNKTACRRRNLRYLKVTWCNLFPHKDRENHSAQERFEAFLEQEYSFYTSLISLWEELVSWGTDLNVSKIAIGLINAGSVYEMLGPRFGVRNSPAFDAVWSKFSRRTTYIQNLPHLPTVKRLVVHASHRIDLWPAIMAVSIAASLPNLDSLAIADHDLAKWWPRARKQLRDELAHRLYTLPSSLRTLRLSLPYLANLYRNEDLPNFLTDKGEDLLSRALHHTTIQLTRLHLQVNQLSLEFFWPPNAPPPDSSNPSPVWQNLKHFRINTSLETAAGTYCFHRAGPTCPLQNVAEYTERWNSFPGDFQYFLEEGGVLSDNPDRYVRSEPDHEFFSDLALAIARAGYCAPQLEDITVEISNYALDIARGRKFVQPYRRSGFYLKCPKSFDEQWARGEEVNSKHPLRPRTEWIFLCPEGQLHGWEEPDEAKQLWKAKIPDIDLDIITLEMRNEMRPDPLKRRWFKRIREGKLVSEFPENTLRRKYRKRGAKHRV